jgi:hypothetical protein
MLQSNNLQACCVLVCVAVRKIWRRQVWVAKTEREGIKWEATMCICVSFNVKICVRLWGMKTSGMIVRNSRTSWGLLNVTRRLAQHLQFFLCHDRKVFLIVEVSRSHSDTRHAIWLLWSSDQPVAETFSWQHTTLTHTHYSSDEIRTRSPSNLTAVDPLLGLRGLFD